MSYSNYKNHATGYRNTQNHGPYIVKKHETLPNPMNSRKEIDQITAISNTLEFDGTTTRWFHIQDKILKDISSDQITNWIKKLKP